MFTCGEQQDPYDLMSPGAPSYSFNPWLTIKFMRPVKVNGIMLQSGAKCQLKSYTVSFMNGQDEVHKLTRVNDNRLLGEARVSQDKFDPVTVTDVRIEVLESADKGTKGTLSMVDFLSPDLKPEKTLFQKYLRYAKAPSERQAYVEIHDAEGYDGRFLHDANKEFSLSTLNDGVWYQWAFPIGALFIAGYRMKTTEMRSWRLIASNNERAEMSDWSVLHEVSIDKKDPALLRQFDVTSELTETCSFKFFRMVATQPGFDGKTHVELSYFDFDGTFCPPCINY